ASTTRTSPTTRAASLAATAIHSRRREPTKAGAPRSNGAFTASRRLSWSAATRTSPTSWWGRSRPTISTRCSSPRSTRRSRRGRKNLGVRRIVGGVFLQQRILQRREHERERHHAEHLETDPEVGRLRAPHDLVQHR